VTFGLTWRKKITKLGGIYECCDHDDMQEIRSGLKTVVYMTGCHYTVFHNSEREVSWSSHMTSGSLESTGKILYWHMMT
jgi:hypothetical protein